MKIYLKLFLAVIGSSALLAPTFAQDFLEQGATIYEEYCEACHQVDGVGFEDTYPALKGNKFVQGDKEELIYLILEGRAGMPTFIADLEKDQLTTILNYIRNSWGNKAELIEQEQMDELYEGIAEEDDGFGSGN